jgi:hypothetical protein
VSAARRYCRCDAPRPEPVEGIEVCAECGEKVADPLLVATFGEVRMLRREVERLAAALDSPGVDRNGTPEPEAGALVSAAEAARRLGVSRDFLYRHADDLGAVRLGTGPKARLRFDLDTVAERIDREPAPEPKRAKRSGRRTRRDGTAPLLPVRGDRRAS